MKERMAAIAVLLTLIAVPGGVWWYEKVHIPSRYGPGVKVINITGFAGTGVWTIEEVSGINYWWKHFEPATIVLEEGMEVVLRLRSSDMTHQFYLPALNIGPLTIRPGHMVEHRFRASKTGIFQYYCTSMCKECHFYMRGWVVVHRQGETPVLPAPIVCPLCSPDFPRPPEGDTVALGEYLYLARGCVTCHGIEGRGGVENFNYLQGTVPAHNTTAEKFFLEEQEEAEEFLDLLVEGVDLAGLAAEPPFAGFRMALVRLQMARDLIKGGKASAKLDPDGPEPPLQMPAWGNILEDSEVDALLAYFLSLYDWEEDWEEDGEEYLSEGGPAVNPGVDP
ncbi:MAG: c-type cytochrome [Deltaproteobacteria bacterium]|nr:c-type cytochrome [Deltaproteobacteria bacterium]